MHDEYIGLINMKYKENISILLLPLILLIAIILSCVIDSYDRYSTDYIYYENQYLVTVPLEYSDKVIIADYVQIKDKTFNFNITKIDYEKNNNYQIWYLTVFNSQGAIDNQVGTIIFKFNKEKIIKKIIELFF